MRFFDPLRYHREFVTEQRADWKPDLLIRRASPKAPLWRSVSCIAFIAAPALVLAMWQAGLPVRAHPLEPDRYVVPHESVNEVTFRDLIRHPEFIFLSTVIFVTSGTSQTSPSDWDNSNNFIEGIGGGASGAVGNLHQTGGGGGEYRKITNFSVATPGTTAFNYVIGGGGTAVTSATAVATNGNDGTDTTFNTSSLIAKAGVHGVSGAGSQSGGAGGTGGTGAAANAAGGRGGNLTGAAGTGASGGGGAGGSTGAGNAGGDSTSTSGNVMTAGGSGDAAAGGSSGGTNGGAGGTGTEWDASHGSGGAGGGNAAPAGGISGGDGGLYGGGGGAGRALNAPITSGAGKQGIIVITYTPVVAARYFLTLLGAS